MGICFPSKMQIFFSHVKEKMLIITSKGLFLKFPFEISIIQLASRRYSSSSCGLESEGTVQEDHPHIWRHRKCPSAPQPDAAGASFYFQVHCLKWKKGLKNGFKCREIKLVLMPISAIFLHFQTVLLPWISSHPHSSPLDIGFSPFLIPAVESHTGF